MPPVRFWAATGGKEPFVQVSGAEGGHATASRGKASVRFTMTIVVTGFSFRL